MTMEQKSLNIDEIRRGGRRSVQSTNNEFIFNLNNIQEIPKIRDLHNLLRDQNALSFAKLLLELTSEKEVTCDDGTYSLVDLRPDSKYGEPNIDETEDGMCSGTFALKIIVKQNDALTSYRIRATLELSTKITPNDCDSVSIRIRFTSIEKMCSIVIYYTIISLKNICENWNSRDRE